MSPGDEFFAFFDWYPYAIPQPTVITPDIASTYITLEMHAKEENWSLNNPLKGNHHLQKITYFI